MYDKAVPVMATLVQTHRCRRADREVDRFGDRYGIIMLEVLPTVVSFIDDRSAAGFPAAVHAFFLTQIVDGWISYKEQEINVRIR